MQRSFVSTPILPCDNASLSKKQHTEILGTHPIGALLARIAIPSSIALFVTSTYSMADAVFVGRGVGAVAIGALTVVMPFQMLVMATGSLIGIGASSIVSRAFGAGESHRANHAAGTAITIAIIGGIVAVVLGEIWIDSILRVLGASGELLIVARRYLSVVLLTEPIIMFNLATNALMRAEGQAKYAMVTMMSGMFLKKLHRIIEPELPPSPKGILETWRQIVEIIKQQKVDPKYQFEAILPE